MKNMTISDDQTQPPTVLVVDDLALNRTIIIEMLKDMGFQRFAEAEDGYHAFQVMQHDSASVVISDYMMSPATGLDLLKAMKSESTLKPVPFIMISAANEEKVIEEAMNLGAEAFMVRPVNYDTLRRTIIEALNR